MLLYRPFRERVEVPVTVWFKDQSPDNFAPHHRHSEKWVCSHTHVCDNRSVRNVLTCFMRPMCQSEAQHNRGISKHAQQSVFVSSGESFSPTQIFLQPRCSHGHRCLMNKLIHRSVVCVKMFRHEAVCSKQLQKKKLQ